MPVTVSHKQQMDLVVSVLTDWARARRRVYSSRRLERSRPPGIHSHGVQRLPVMVTRIQKGLLNVKAQPEKTWSTGAVLNIDGKDGFGTAICELGLRELVPA